MRREENDNNRKMTKDRRNELRFHPIVLAGVAIALILCFALGYHHGVTTWEKQYAITLSSQKIRERQVTGLKSACEEEYARLESKDLLRGHHETAHTTKAENDELLRQIDDENTEYEEVVTMEQKCKDELATLQAEDGAQTASERNAIENVKDEIASLQATLDRLSGGDGVYSALTLESLNAAWQKYRRMCGRLPRCTVLSSPMLLEKWKKEVGSLPQVLWHTESRNSQHMLWLYDAADRRNADIFFPDDNNNNNHGNSNNNAVPPQVGNENSKEERQPTYFLRSGNPPEFVGGTAEEPPLVSSVLERIQEVYNFALCAYRRRNANFTVPSNFRWRDAASNVTRLYRLIQTPLVTLCRNCKSMATSSEFSLACHDSIATGQAYGKREYWAMRSMVLPHPRITRQAREFYELNFLNGQNVLAVVVQNSAAACHAYREKPRDNHYLYLAANFPAEKSHFVEHVSNDTMYQCAPTAKLVAARITKVVEEFRKLTGNSFDAIYLSSSNEFREQLSEVAERLEWLGSMLATASGTAETAAQELNDLVIASMATAILVSPYLAPSQYVAEAFLLRHKLRPMQRVWLF